MTTARSDVIALGKVHRLGPLSWRWEVTQGMWTPPIMHFELQLKWRRVCMTVVISRELR
jgi:hypothetical protein